MQTNLQRDAFLFNGCFGLPEENRPTSHVKTMPFVVSKVLSGKPHVAAAPALQAAQNVHTQGWGMRGAEWSIIAVEAKELLLKRIDHRTGEVTPFGEPLPNIAEITSGKVFENLGLFALVAVRKGSRKSPYELFVFEMQSGKRLVAVPIDTYEMLVGYQYKGKRFLVFDTKLVNIEAQRIKRLPDRIHGQAFSPSDGCLYVAIDVVPGRLDPRRILCLEPETLAIKSSRLVGVARREMYQELDGGKFRVVFDHDARGVRALFLMPDGNVLVALDAGIEYDDHYHVIFE